MSNEMHEENINIYLLIIEEVMDKEASLKVQEKNQKDLKRKIDRTTADAEKKALKSQLGETVSMIKTFERDIAAELNKLPSNFGARYKALSTLHVWAEKMEKDSSWKESEGGKKLKKRVRDEFIRTIKSADSLNVLIEKFPVLHIPKIPDLASLPPHSFFLQFKFSLARPYISKDDETFHICENPVRKDKVFKVPMVEGSSWKGNLRWMATKMLADEIAGLSKEDAIKRRLQLIRLFGTEKEGVKKPDDAGFEAYLDGLFVSEYGENAVREFRDMVRTDNLVNKDGMGKGRLHFYPTFFDNIGLEVINPHNRRTKAGTVPVNIECAPVGASGHFSLLYLAGFNATKEESAGNMESICIALKEMMLTYGFSAKKSAGYGVIEKKLSKDGAKGILKLKGEADRKFDNLDSLAAEAAYYKEHKCFKSEVVAPVQEVVINDDLINTLQNQLSGTGRRK